MKAQSFLVQFLSALFLLILVSMTTLTLVLLNLTGAYLEDHWTAQLNRTLETLDLLDRNRWRELLGGASPPDSLSQREGFPLRLTLMDRNGRVILDTHHPEEHSSDHSSRPEVQQALERGRGQDRRISATLGRELIYVSRRISDAQGRTLGVLRLADFPDSGQALGVLGIRLVLAATFLLLGFFLLTVLYTLRLRSKIRLLVLAAESYAGGNLGFRVNIASPKELQILGHTMSQMARDLDQKMALLVNKNSELEATLGAMEDGLIILDQELRVQRMNESARNLLAVPPDREPLGEPFAGLCPSGALVSYAESCLLPRKWDERGQKQILMEGREPRYFQVSAGRLGPGQEGPTGLVLVIHDITRVKQLENIRRDFVANVSHELKTPLTSIIGFVETLREGALDQKATAERFLEIVWKQVLRMKQIIDDLLSLSQLEQGGARRLNSQELLISEILEGARQVCAPRMEAQAVQLITEGNWNESARVFPLLMEQALVNFMDNGIKFSPPGSTLWVRCKTEQKGPVEWIRLEIQDQGPGIPQKDQSRLFERFYRVDKARSQDMGGTGLGLAIVKHILQIHGGEVGVSSRPGSGSLFWMEFPRSLPGEGSTHRNNQDRP